MPIEYHKTGGTSMERFSIWLNRILPEVKTEPVNFSTGSIPESIVVSVENFSENVEKL